jgi:hypothetical protein
MPVLVAASVVATTSGVPNAMWCTPSPCFSRYLEVGGGAVVGAVDPQHRLPDALLLVDLAVHHLKAVSAPIELDTRVEIPAGDADVVDASDHVRLRERVFTVYPCGDPACQADLRVTAVSARAGMGGHCGQADTVRPY